MLYGELLPPDFPDRYKKGVWLFNNRHFFECHEILEELWMDTVGTEKIFYQMIIHAAVTFVHWENKNRKGVLSLEHTFHLKAKAVPAEKYQGLDIARLRRDMSAIVDPLRVNMELPLPPFETLVTPTIQVEGFEPLECTEHELLVLGRHIEKEDD